MSNNWKQTVNRINRDKYQVPVGWDTKEQVALSLECDPSRVADILRPGIEAGEIERQQFPVWDDHRRMAVCVTCYRTVPRNVKEDPRRNVRDKDVVTKQTGPKRFHVAEESLEDKIRRSIRLHPDWTVHRLVKNHRGATTALVRSLMQ